MLKQIRVILANQYDLVVGDTFQLFYRSIIESPNPYIYSIVAVCEKGASFPRYFEYTPQEQGKHTLTISIYDANRNLLGSASTILNVVVAKKPEKPINVLCIGDSLTYDGEWVEEVRRRINDEGGKPCGLGFNKVNFVGNCKAFGVGYEGFGGWTWDRFYSDKVGAIWVESQNDKTPKDQHSLWQDENGAIWQLETIQIDYLKFNRYKEQDFPRPESGILTHYKNAVNTKPIAFNSSFDEQISPFYDIENNSINFKSYVNKLGISQINVVYILLGWNGLMRPQAINNTKHEYCKLVIKEAKVLVDKIKADLPNVKIKVMAPPKNSVNGGVGNTYGADLPFANLAEMDHYVIELNLAYKNWAKEDEYKDFVEFINLTGQFDIEYCYPHIQKPVNTRCSITEQIDTDACHPNHEGKMQIADAVYRNLIKEISK